MRWGGRGEGVFGGELFGDGGLMMMFVGEGGWGKVVRIKDPGSPHDDVQRGEEPTTPNHQYKEAKGNQEADHRGHPEKNDRKTG